jgi:Na+-driven multidrug efflux pump
MVQLSAAVGIVLGLLLVALHPLVPRIFSDDHTVRRLSGFLLLYVALLQPLSGVAFALDGILIGAGDQRYLAYAMTLSSLSFVPLAIAVDVRNAGIGWLWAAMIAFMAVRSATLWHRFRTKRWIVIGAVR